MRPIDADKLKDTISSYTGMFDDDGEFWVSLTSVLSGIDFAETVDAAPVVHAKWKIVKDDDGNEMMQCPVCRSEFYDGDNDTVDHLPNYCSNCGARTDGDRNGQS